MSYAIKRKMAQNGERWETKTPISQCDPRANGARRDGQLDIEGQDSVVDRLVELVFELDEVQVEFMVASAEAVTYRRLRGAAEVFASSATQMSKLLDDVHGVISEFHGGVSTDE